MKLQDTVFELRGNILGFNGFADIECSGAAACVTLLTNVLAGLLIGFVFIKAFDSADIQITIFDGDRNLVFLEARQINIYLVSILGFPHICLHEVLCMFAIQRILLTEELTLIRPAHPVVHILK